MNDNNKDSWIEYFIWELDFGKKYREGSVTSKDGRNLSLKNSEDLWNMLIFEN